MLDVHMRGADNNGCIVCV